MPRGETVTPRPEQVLAWQAEGTRLVERAVAALTDADLAAASALPGWTRAHLVAHLARNADALVNLLDWAATGEPHPMYAAPGRREQDIEASAAQQPDVLRADLWAADARLAKAVADLPAVAWAARVRSAQGRDIPATEVPWLRVREVWVHLVDLGGRWTPADLPADLIGPLLVDVTTALGRKPDAPAVALVADDGTRNWAIGRWDIDTAPMATVTGSPAGLLGWATGRTPGADLSTDGPLPALPRWL
jgi:maleylpyruvate isomerase